MLNAEEILKRAERKLKKFSQSQTKELPSSGQDRPWQNNGLASKEVASSISPLGEAADEAINKATKITKTIIKEDNSMNNYTKVPINQPEANLRQTGVKLESNWSHNWSQSGVKVDAQPNANWMHNLMQTGCKLDAQPNATFETGCKPNASISHLSGLQLKLVSFVYDECKIARAKITKCLTIEYIIATLKAPCPSIKSAIQRLIKKQYIVRVEFKNGRGGWSIYSIPDLIFQELLRRDETGCKLDANWMQCSRFEQKLDAQPNASLPVVSSSINITTTTDPEAIDCSPLSGEGFGNSHIIQIRQEYKFKPELALSDEIIQNSIDAMAFDLKHNNVASRFKNPPTTVLVSMLKKGNPYSSITPDKFLTPQQEAMRDYLAAQAKNKSINYELENKSKETAFKDWLSALPEEELLEYVKDYTRLEGVPEKIYQTSKRKKALASAKDYFEMLIWPQKLKQILNTKRGD